MATIKKPRKPVKFITKLYYEILESNKYSDLIRWCENVYLYITSYILHYQQGLGFKVLDKHRLVHEVLNVVFSEKQYISFTRNLKLYKFELKDGVYRHPNFIRHHPEKLILFRRSKKLLENINNAESPKNVIDNCFSQQVTNNHSSRSLDEHFNNISQSSSDDANFYSHNIDKLDNLIEHDNMLSFEDPFYNNECNINNDNLKGYNNYLYNNSNV